jgi:hypothetical protein
MADVATAQNRPASPRGNAATQIGENWIEVDYGRPILRGRTDIFGEGDSYGQTLYAGAPVWRAGANVSTRIKTEMPLQFGDNTLEPGEYSMFVDLSGGDWTLIISNHKAKTNYQSDEEGLWGAYGYTPDQDAFRVPMEVANHPHSVDQFTISFLDVTPEGGTLAMTWHDTTATVDFTVN